MVLPTSEYAATVQHFFDRRRGYANQPRDERGRWAKSMSASLETKYPGALVRLSEAAPGLTQLDMVKVPKELRGQGVGSAIMRELVAEADKVGMTLSLTPQGPEGDRPMSDAKLKRWYQSYGFVPNKGRKKDFRTMESMIRSPGGSA